MSEMAKKSERKLFLFGRYSLALLPPKRWLTEAGVKAGDRVELEFDRKRKRIVVRLPKADDDETLEKSQDSKTKKGKSTGRDGVDWQPVPQLAE